MKEFNASNIIDLGKVVKVLWRKRKYYIYVLSITFVLACVWIFPQPRYYDSSVALAPEATGESLQGGLSSIASSFGFNLGDLGGSDAIYPLLYPDLFTSPEFVVGLFDIRVKSIDGEIDTDYYTYLKDHQKDNVLTRPFRKAMSSVRKLFESDDALNGSGKGTSERIDPFMMSKKDFNIMELAKGNITCSVDKKNNVVTIAVRDQDALIAATMADSVKQHLQDFIIRYRTSKARQDLAYYQNLADSAKLEYEQAMTRYSNYTDSHKDIILQAYLSERDKLENDMTMKYNAYTAFVTQLQAMKAKVQERTPSFMTLCSATVPVKAAGPKRMIFVAGMLVLAFAVASVWFARNVLLGKDD